ncbi:MAG: MFS transporter, partial [Candidatus Cloacimonetes bacterium]|nr:MFS transporter [Candidatus Cloacimonadota bacterium]
NIFLYQLIFVLAGVFVASYKIAIEGILLEISNNENRATYTGIAGAGNLLPTIFPLVSGLFITFFGYVPTFILLSIFIGLSIYFITKLKCK